MQNIVCTIGCSGAFDIHTLGKGLNIQPFQLCKLKGQNCWSDDKFLVCKIRKTHTKLSQMNMEDTELAQPCVSPKTFNPENIETSFIILFFINLNILIAI